MLLRSQESLELAAALHGRPRGQGLAAAQRRHNPGVGEPDGAQNSWSLRILRLELGQFGWNFDYSETISDDFLLGLYFRN